MLKFKNKWMLLIIGLVAVVVVGAVGFALGKGTVPARVVAHYGRDFLLEEAQTMNECAECHDAADFHTCTTCHDDHGAVEFAEVPFFNMVAFTGDVPDPGFVRLNDILPYRERPYTHLPLLDFLAAQGVTTLESVTLASNDGGFVTIEQANLNENALLLPYVDGIRFASEDLHVSTWLKGITQIIVVGEESSLTVNGEATSIGRLLLGPTRSVTVQQTSVMFVSEADGEVREAMTANRLIGVPVAEVLESFETLTVTDASGSVVSFSAAEALDALLVAERGGVTLVLPGYGRAQWVEQVVEIQSK